MSNIVQQYLTMYNNNSNIIIHFILCNSHTQYTYITPFMYLHNVEYQYIFFYNYEKPVYTYV